MQIVEPSVARTVTLLDLYDARDLTDESEMIAHHVAPVDFETPMQVRMMAADEARAKLRAPDGRPLIEVFEQNATKAQKRLVKQKARDFDEDRIIVVTNDGTVVDGNHHAVAAIQSGRPIQYVYLADLD